jgi:hypothetical protein
MRLAFSPPVVLATGRHALRAFGLVVITTGPTLASGGLPDFGWTLSASSTDPFVNNGPATKDTLDLYLWLFCSNDTSGVDGVELGVGPCTLGLQIIDFEPSQGVVENPVSYCGDVNLSLPGCPRGTHLAGRFTVLSDVPTFDVCIVPTAFGTGVSETYSCAAPTIGRAHATIGYTTQPKPTPCSQWLEFFDYCSPPTSVEVSSWGRLKSLYAD